MATTIAPGFGAYTELSEPGAGSTDPALGLGLGVGVACSVGTIEGTALGDGVPLLQAARPATSATERHGRRRCAMGLGR
jgi:hypothetical protein